MAILFVILRTRFYQNSLSFVEDLSKRFWLEHGVNGLLSGSCCVMFFGKGGITDQLHTDDAVLPVIFSFRDFGVIISNVTCLSAYINDVLKRIMEPT